MRVRATVLSITYIDPRYQPRSVSSLYKAAQSRTKSSAVQLCQLHFCSDSITRQGLRLCLSQVSYRKCTRRFPHTLLRRLELLKRKLRDLSRNIYNSCISSTSLLFFVLTLSDIYVVWI